MTKGPGRYSQRKFPRKSSPAGVLARMEARVEQMTPPSEYLRQQGLLPHRPGSLNVRK